MTDPKVSIILIGYNDAARLPNALESLTSQSFREIEIIAVDDCSTDGSVEILRAAAGTDPRIRVEVLAQNSGPSAPRNRGMELASAPLIMFCDSDDRYDPHAVHNLYSAISSMGADLVVGATTRIISSSGERKIWHPELYLESRVVLGLAEEPRLLFETISVNKIYRARFLREHEIEFPPGLIFEDQLFTLKCYLAATRIGIIPEVVYYWNVEPDADVRSITQSRHESRNATDRIAINQLMDRELESDHTLGHLKNQKFLQHELSLYLGTLFRLPESDSAELIDILSQYVRRIPIEDFECLRPGVRVAVYYLLTGDQGKMRQALWWEKGGGFINTSLAGRSGELWSSESADLLGRPAAWWLDVSDLHLDLIPFERRSYFSTMSKSTGADNWVLACVDFAGDLPRDTQAQVILRETRTGALIAFSGTSVESESGVRSYHVNLDSGGAELVQDRGINSDEHGIVCVQLTCSLGVNRSDLHLEPGQEIRPLPMGRLASLGCADRIDFEVQADSRIHWSAAGSAKSVMGAVRRLRRSRNRKPTSSHLPIVKVKGRPTVVFAPTDLPSSQRVRRRFDTQAWIDEFGTTVYLLIPREEFIDRPRRSRFAYWSYPPSQRPAVLAIADIVITDRPELIDDPRSIVFRRDLGASDYLLAPIDAAVVDDQSALHQALRERLQAPGAQP